ncbi:FAD binding domain protein [Apodospora peruviana]|uniref:FAD binding domain protein n=1 Tax=Apodospora peruviana TaxID=516989 RepID=A0AAE0I0W2_9PEZI|nr:FAD binding domain protein [Apodospora peruviana]
MEGSRILLRDSTDPAIFRAAVWGRVFNACRDLSRVPFAVCKARTVADIVAAVELAKAKICRVSVRAGGHSWAAWSVRQDAVLIDVENLDLDLGRDRIDYDDKTNIVSCPPGITGRMLNEFLATVNRMFAGGHCPDVGLGGFLLQGGMGWNCKNWGWACESVVAIDVVTTDGKQLLCNTTEHPDLFWAARGAGPGFPAIVTRFYLKTRPLLQMWQNLYIFPISEYKKVLQWEIEIAPTVDPDTEMVGVSSFIPLTDGKEAELTILANFTTFKPSLKEATVALAPIHAAVPSGAKISVFCQPTSFEKEYAQQIKTYPQGWRYCSDNAYISPNCTDIVGVLEESFSGLVGQKSCALWFSMNPRSMRDHKGEEMALSMQSDHYFALYTVWEDEKDDQKYQGWVADMMKKVERYSVGSYLGDADFRVRRTKFWSAEVGEKLREVRRKWDPEGRICGFLDEGDKSGVNGLRNDFEWEGS